MSKASDFNRRKAAYNKGFDAGLGVSPSPAVRALRQIAKMRGNGDTNIDLIYDIADFAMSTVRSEPKAGSITENQKEVALLRIIEAMGGETDASEYALQWLNWFCNDEIHNGQSDTFNRCIDRGWLSSSHNSDWDTSTAWLTDAGRAWLSSHAQDEAPTIAAFERDHPELYWHIAKGKITAGEPLYGAIITDVRGNEIAHGESDVSAEAAFKIAALVVAMSAAAKQELGQ